MTIEYSKLSIRQLKKLDKEIARRIVDYMDEVSNLSDPKSRGKALQGNLRTLWRYRVGDYRIICSIKADRLIITVLRVGHRRDVYSDIPLS